jgi:hypothetical protein
MNKKYAISFKDENRLALDLDVSLIKGFDFKPKNNVKYDGIVVSRATIINPEFIESILKRKNNNKIERYLDYILHLLSDEDSGEDAVVIALDELHRFRMMIMNKQKQFLKDKYIEALLKKIGILEEELKIKRMSFNEKEETRKRSR